MPVSWERYFDMQEEAENGAALLEMIADGLPWVIDQFGGDTATLARKLRQQLLGVVRDAGIPVLEMYINPGTALNSVSVWVPVELAEGALVLGIGREHPDGFWRRANGEFYWRQSAEMIGDQLVRVRPLRD